MRLEWRQIRATNFGHARLIQEPENMTKVSGTPPISILLAHATFLFAQLRRATSTYILHSY